MAFHQPTRHVAQQRIVRIDPASDADDARIALPPQVQSRDDSQTWILFSPATDAGTTTSYLSSVQGDQPTPGRSRISDLGSLQTVTHSDDDEDDDDDIDNDQEEAVEDDAELDSLDSHLPEFRQQTTFLQSSPILPGHDGLGSFRLDSQLPTADMQAHMYQFERYNPQRVKRRRESLELGQLALEREETQDADRRRRIEEWRLEQSMILLREIQKETRRRRDSTVSALTNRLRRGSQVSLDPEADEAAMSTAGQPTPDTSVAGTEWHDQDAPELDFGAGQGPEIGMWSRITRRVIRDLMGIDDDRLLCVLFGDALPEDLDLDADDDELASTPKAFAPEAALCGTEFDPSWQLRALDRIARELGHLISRLSLHPHPGAFSTYMRMQVQQQHPLTYYAGLPVIPEATVPTLVGAETDGAPVISRRAASFSQAEGSAMPTVPQFQPTLLSAQQKATKPIDIPRAVDGDAPHTQAGGTFTQQEWEQDLDIKLVFRYLRNRFTSSRAASSSTSIAQSNNPSTLSPERAAARVRQHHPLVRQRRKSFKISGGPSVPAQLVNVHHHHGSCASQSTRRSGRRGSLSVSSSRHSSRHYWDIGGGAGSLGTGSLIASTGPMGSWGEI